MSAETTPFKQVFLQGIDITANVRSIEIEDNDRLIDKAVVVLNDPRNTAAEAPREGNTLLIDLGWGDSHAILFEGEVTQIASQESGCDPKQVTVTALDLSYRLRKRPFRATNHVGTLSAILQRIITREASTDIGVGQIAPDPNPEFSADAPLRQSTHNDWDFIVELARRYNCRTFVEYNGGESKFYFIPVARLLTGDPLGTLSAGGMAGRILRFDYNRTASRASARTESASVDAASGEVVATTVPPPPAEPAHTPDSTTAETGGSTLDNALAVAGEATEIPQSQRPEGLRTGLPSDPARAASETVQDPTIALGFTARGACVGTIMLRAKGRVSVTGISGWGTGPWYVRKVKHVLRLSGGRMQPSFTNEFELTR